MDNIKYMVSPNFDIEYLRKGGDAAKIGVYEDRVKGWIIEQAEFVAKNSGSGFAELLIILSFFEGHARYLPDSPSGSGRRFKHVVKKVFPNLEHLAIASRVLKYLWEDGRCGLYHGGITGDKITISGRGYAIAVLKEDNNYRLDINPGRFVKSVKEYFESFIRELRVKDNKVLRRHFFSIFG